MTDDSKKLTVSFGNFTCTLDGYDDPVPVLSRVIEQFQSVSKDEPNFAAATSAQSEEASGDFDGAEANWETYNVEALEAAEPSERAKLDATDIGDTAETGAWELPSFDDASAKSPEAAQASDESAEEAFEPVSVEEVVPEEEVEAAPQNPGALLLQPSIDAPVAKVADEAPDTDAEIDSAVAAIQNALPAHDAEPPADDIETDVTSLEQSPSLLAEEEAAIERMIAASRDRDMREPDLAPTNPLARLRDQAQNSDPQDSTDQAGDAAQDATPAPLHLGEPVPSASAPVKAETEAPLRLSPLTLNAPVASPPQIDASEAASAIFADSTEPTGEEVAPESPEQPDAATTNDEEPLSQNTQEFIEALGSDEPEAPFRLEPKAEAKAEDPGILRLVPEAEASAQAAAPEEAAAADDPAHELRNFAASMGATSLAEQMEASAAYVTLIEGQPTFTRREIFDHFDALNGDGHVSFEARIKTLSRLLRTGVLERSEDGSFSLSTAARAQYEERASA